jgi:cytoskeletal protein RodZ
MQQPKMSTHKTQWSSNLAPAPHRPPGPTLTESPPSTPTTDLDARYGRDRRSRRWLLIGVLAVVVLAGLTWLAWAAIVGSNPQVTSRLLGFEVTSATSAKATIQVDRTKSVEASCRLQAKAADFSIVGELTLTVPADSPRHQTLPATLTTQRSATSVVLIGCTTADSHHPH